MMAENRIKREEVTREKTARKSAWTRPVSYTHLTLPTIYSV